MDVARGFGVVGAVLGLTTSPFESIFGVIWMIFRVRVGGGGSEYSDSCCRRPFSSARASQLGDGGIAGGGRANEVLSFEGNRELFSLPTRSIDEAGVGGKTVRGMAEQC